MALIRFFQLVLLFCFSCHAFAIEAPQQVYRVDTRHPDEIFQHGFEAWGNIIEVLRHVTGTSIVDRTSGLVSTTSDFGVARNIVSRYLLDEDHDEAEIWIYIITPGFNFYDVNASLLHAFMHGVGDLMPGQALYTHAVFGHEREFAADGLISTTQIQGALRATRIVLPNGEEDIHIDDLEHGVPNPEYTPTYPQISPENLPIVEMPEDFEVYYDGDLQLYPVTAALGVNGCIGVGGETQCKKTKFSKVVDVIERKVFATFN